MRQIKKQENNMNNTYNRLLDLVVEMKISSAKPAPPSNKSILRKSNRPRMGAVAGSLTAPEYDAKRMENSPTRNRTPWPDFGASKLGISSSTQRETRRKLNSRNFPPAYNEKSHKRPRNPDGTPKSI